MSLDTDASEQPPLLVTVDQASQSSSERTSSSTVTTTTTATAVITTPATATATATGGGSGVPASFPSSSTKSQAAHSLAQLVVPSFANPYYPPSPPAHLTKENGSVPDVGSEGHGMPASMGMHTSGTSSNVSSSTSSSESTIPVVDRDALAELRAHFDARFQRLEAAQVALTEALGALTRALSERPACGAPPATQSKSTGSSSYSKKTVTPADDDDNSFPSAMWRDLGLTKPQPARERGPVLSPAIDLEQLEREARSEPSRSSRTSRPSLLSHSRAVRRTPSPPPMHDPPDSLGFSVDKHRVPSQFRSPPSARGKGVHQVDSEEDEIVVVPHLNGIIELGLDLEDDGDDGDDDVEMLSDGAHDIPDERVMSLWVSSDEEEEEGEVDERDDSDDEKPIPIAPKTKVTIFAGPKAKSSASRFVAPAQFLRSILSPSPSGESTSHPESTPQATSSASPERNATFFRHGSAVATPLPRKLASAARANAAPYHKVKDEDIEELPSPIKGGRRRPPKSPSTAKSPVKPTKSPAKSPIKAKKPATPRASTSEPATLPGKRAKRSSVSASPTKTTKRIKKETIDELASLSTGTSASRHAHALAAGPMKLQASDGISRGNGKWPSFPEGWDKLTMITDEVVCDRCNGRVHWGCAGVGPVGTTVESPWFCPDCKAYMSTGSEDMILPAPPGRCIRFNCLRRRKIRVVVEEGDEDRYHVDKIVGRRAVARHTDGSRIFEYLVLWDGWPIEDGTWEPRVNLTHDSNGHCQFIEDFDKEAAARGLNIRKRVALLQEALPWWDPETGNLATQGRATGIQ